MPNQNVLRFGCCPTYCIPVRNGLAETGLKRTHLHEKSKQNSIGSLFAKNISLVLGNSRTAPTTCYGDIEKIQKL